MVFGFTVVLVVEEEEGDYDGWGNRSGEEGKEKKL